MIRPIEAIAVLLALAGLAAAGPARADEGDQPGERRARALEAYDTDGDGKLSDAERAAAREQREKRRLEHLDTDGDGKVSDAERAAAQQQRQKRRLEHLDTDGDGKVSDAERAAAQQQHRDRRAEILQKYDADGDGRLNEAEQEAARADGVRTGRGWAKGHVQGGPKAGEPGAGKPR